MHFGASTWLWTSPFTGDQVELLEKFARRGLAFLRRWWG